MIIMTMMLIITIITVSCIEPAGNTVVSWPSYRPTWPCVVCQRYPMTIHGTKQLTLHRELDQRTTSPLYQIFTTLDRLLSHYIADNDHRSLQCYEIMRNRGRGYALGLYTSWSPVPSTNCRTVTSSVFALLMKLHCSVTEHISLDAYNNNSNSFNSKIDINDDSR